MATRKAKGLEPQIIQGMTLATLLRVLARNNFQVDTQCLGRLAHLLVLGVFNHIYGSCETMFNARDIRNTTLKHPPLFVLGHWRSGTTHLHNMLSLDENLSSPTAYQALFPHHFIFTQVAGRLMDFVGPSKRPMDNVAFGSQVPHEDEFAMTALAEASPYLRILFPVTQDAGYAELDPERLPQAALEKWKQAFDLFLKKVTLSEGGRIVLKSPPHMGRVRVLLEMFPKAQFVHIVRDPYAVYLSCWRLWEAMFACAHLQIPPTELVDELILSWYVELFRLFERDKELIPPESFYEVKFEDLEARPVETMRAIYRGLDLGGYDCFEKRLVSYLESLGGYEKNSYHLDEVSRDKVSQRWGHTFDRYGYCR